MHSGLTDPRAMGRKGGDSTETALRKQARKDDTIFEKARGVMIAALDGSDEKRRFEAGSKLFSYRAQVPPAETRIDEQTRPLTPKGRPVEGLEDVIDFMTQHPETGLLEMIAPAIERAHEELQRRRTGTVTLAPLPRMKGR